MTQAPAMTTDRSGVIGAWVGSFLLVAVMVVAMRAQGRVWLCDCDSPWTVWKGDVWSSHCSQHMLDPYSFTHFTHGLIFCVALGWAARAIGAWTRRGFSVHGRFFAAVFLASAWEVAENSSWVIERYRTVTMSLDYLGDSVLNAVMDVACCAAGFWVSRRIGVRWSLALLLVIEVALLVTTRDNLTLNVLMLISPVDTIKQWQMAGR